MKVIRYLKFSNNQKQKEGGKNANHHPTIQN